MESIRARGAGNDGRTDRHWLLGQNRIGKPTGLLAEVSKVSQKKVNASLPTLFVLFDNKALWASFVIFSLLFIVASFQ